MKVSLFIQECGSHNNIIYTQHEKGTLDNLIATCNGTDGGTRGTGGACYDRRSSHNKHQCHRKAYRVCLADRNS